MTIFRIKQERRTLLLIVIIGHGENPYEDSVGNLGTLTCHCLAV